LVWNICIILICSTATTRRNLTPLLRRIIFVGKAALLLASREPPIKRRYQQGRPDSIRKAA
jgi:hypothetical protein